MARLDGVPMPGTGVFETGGPAALADAVRACDLVGRRVGVEAQFLTWDLAEALSRIAVPVEIEALLAGARAVKDDDEIEMLRRGVAVIEGALRTVVETVHEGLTGIALAHAAMTHVSTQVGRVIAFAGNLGSGPDDLDPDSAPSTRAFRRGDTIFLDFYPDLGGYSADLTRCFSVGQPSADAMRIHTIVEHALEAGLAAIHPGAKAWEIDAAIQRVFEAHGMLACVRHRSGHGLGLFLREPPWLAPGDETLLATNMVLAIEPGLYVPGVGGFRLEVNLQVTDDGCEVLGDLPTRMCECGVV